MIAKLTVQQKDLLIGQKYNNDIYFNPLNIDIDCDFFISEGEITECTNKDFQWVKFLPLTEYIRIPSIGQFDSVNYDKQGGIALAVITYYADKLVMFRYNKTFKTVLVSELNAEGVTHLNNTLGIINQNNYSSIEYQRGGAYFYVYKTVGDNVLIKTSSLTEQQNTTLNLAGAYFMALLNN